MIIFHIYYDIIPNYYDTMNIVMIIFHNNHLLFIHNNYFTFIMMHASAHFAPPEKVNFLRYINFHSHIVPRNFC